MTRSDVSLLLSLALLSASATACDGDASHAQSAPPPPPPAVVVVGSVEVRTVPIEGEFVGRTAARDTVRIMPRVTGLLETASFVEGSVVKAGDPLFQIERRSYEIALDAARARLAQDRAGLGKARRDLGRLQPLLAEQVVSKSEVDATGSNITEREAAMKANQAALAKAELDLEYTTIRAPLTGVVGKLEVAVGNLVTPGQAAPLTTISSYDPMYVYFTMPEATFLGLRKKHGVLTEHADEVPLTLVLADGQPYEHKGKIDFVDRAVDPTTGTLSLRAAFPNADRMLRPGQFARVRFEVERKENAVLVPRMALTQLQSQRSVFVVGPDNKVTQTPVTVDGEVDGMAIVTKGLVGGETVVTEGTQKLRPGATVAPKAPTKAGDAPEDKKTETGAK